MKKVIIVGGSSGIGEQLAKDMTTKGYIIGITGRRKELLEKLRKQHNDKIEIQDFDVSDTKIATEQMEKLLKKIGGMDILVLSAGTGQDNFNLDFDIEYETIKTNIIGWTNIIDWATKYFIKQGFGHIVAITSIASLRGTGGCPSYNATKAYQSNYIESLRLNIDKRDLPIQILEVQPGFVNTRMAQGNLFWVCPVPKASKQILQAIEKGKKHIYVSKKWRLFAWIMKISPYKIYKKIVNGL